MHCPLIHSSRSCMFCDHGIVVSGCKQILAARSPYFRALLFGDMIERDEKCIRMHGASGRVFSAVIEFLHTDNIATLKNSITKTTTSHPEEVDPLLKKDLIELCAELLEVLDLAKQYFIPKLESIIVEELAQICKTKQELIHYVTQFCINI